MIIKYQKVITKQSTLSGKYTYIYDNQKNILEENSYDSDGYLSSKTTYEYDLNANKVLKALTYIPTSSGLPIITRHTYKYDANGNEIEHQRYALKETQTTHSKYSSDGNLIETYYYVTFDDSNTIFVREKKIFKHDEKGNVIETTTFSFLELSEIFKNAPTDKDKLMEQNAMLEYLYKYDDNPKPELTEKGIRNELSRIRETYKYDEYNNILEEASYKDYDSFDSFLFGHSFIYKYDNRGNWIYKEEYKEDSYENKKLVKVIEREIEYY